MTRTEAAQFRKRDFRVAVESDHAGPVASVEFAKAIYRARPSRLDNVLEIEVFHKPDSHVHQTVQMICDSGLRLLTLESEYPIPSAVSADPCAYRNLRTIGKVLDQWTD
jgi:hypothetical protein